MITEKHTSKVDIARSKTLHAAADDHPLEEVSAGLNVSKDDGQVTPQPSADPNDPLNWAQSKKNLTLLIISAMAFLADYGSATGAVTLIPQAKKPLLLTNRCGDREWGLSEDTVNHANVGNLFMIGAGGVFAAAFAAFFGRLPVFFWFAVAAFTTAAWSAGAGSFPSFMAARILNGFFSTVSQGASYAPAELISTWTRAKRMPRLA
ncbi:MAG: hypothetical protein Q9207_007703 [Kuettlingeria erythrocarpa]